MALSPLRDRAAVQDNCVTIDPCASSRGEEDGCAGNVLWFSRAPTRDLGHCHLVDLVIVDGRFGHVAREEARRNGVHIDLVFRKICREVFGEVDDARLTG